MVKYRYVLYFMAKFSVYCKYPKFCVSTLKPRNNMNSHYSKPFNNSE